LDGAGHGTNVTRLRTWAATPPKIPGLLAWWRSGWG
jgi:hypothetical protein